MLRIVGTTVRTAPLLLGAFFGIRHGEWIAVAIVAAVAVVVVAIGAVLHAWGRGRITWRTVLAAWLLPWGRTFGGPSLGGIAAAAFGAWIVLGTAGAVGVASPQLFVAWLLDGFALRVLGRSSWRFGNRWQRRAVVRLSAITVCLALAGLVAHTAGHPWLGAVVAAGPIVLVGTAAAVFAETWAWSQRSRMS